MRASVLLGLAGLALQAAGCSSSAGQAFYIDGSGGKVAYSDSANPTLSGTTLTIPPGSVSQPVAIQIATCDGLAQSTDTAVGPCVRLLPADLIFTPPASLTIPYQPDQVSQQALLEVRTVISGSPGVLPPAALHPDPLTKTIATDIRTLGDFQAVVATPPPPPPPPTKDADILFLIDNSPSMTSKQKALLQNVPRFLAKLDAAGVSYHIGVATSDVGSNVMPGQPWGGNIGKCDTYEGDDGVLQAVACDARTDVTPDAKNACASLCPDDKFLPNDGHRFISKVDGVTNVPVSLELDPESGKMVDRGPTHALQCMGLVGDSGCGIEGQLEGAKRALDGHRSENSGFLRPNSVLAVLFLTDEDDCSVQLAKRYQNNPVTRDCDPTQPDSYDCYNVDFRCLARSIQCDQTTLVPGVKTHCTSRPNNYLETIDKYYKFYSTLRPKNRLVVQGIWALPALDHGGKLIVAQGMGGTSTPFLNRATGADAACDYDATIFGQAQLRLSQFVASLGAAGKASESSLCNLDQYATVLDQFASDIAAQLKP